jgi:hypothetical protein
MRGYVMVLLLAAVGCGVSPQDQVAEVAEAYCKCVLPSDTTCPAQVESSLTSVTDACVTCVFEHQHRCASMQEDCTQLCTTQQTPGGP